MPERRLRLVRALGRASDADLICGLVRRDEQALDELAYRHAAALSVLACAFLRQPVGARSVVDDVFASVWAEPDQVGGADASVRAQLAGLVHERCRTMEQNTSVAATPERVAVALIAFGDHTCRQAAERVGSAPTVIAERLRAFVLDPDRFTAFRSADDNVVPLRHRRPAPIAP
jgi:hypothetical protein